MHKNVCLKNIYFDSYLPKKAVDFLKPNITNLTGNGPVNKRRVARRESVG